jgi:hypothetical protein
MRFFFCGLPKSHPRATAVLVNEFDAGQFESSPHNVECRATRLTPLLFELVNSHDANTCFFSQVLLSPAE